MQTDIFSFSQKSCKEIRRGGAEHRSRYRPVSDKCYNQLDFHRKGNRKIRQNFLPSDGMLPACQTSLC